MENARANNDAGKRARGADEVSKMAVPTMMQLACKPILDAQAAGNINAGAGGALLGSDWLLLSVLALVVSTIALALLYMFASFFRHPQLLIWTKFELFQVFATATVMVFFTVALIGSCTFDMGLLDQKYKGLNMFQIIGDYFAKLEKAGYLIFSYIMYLSKILTFLSRTTVLSSPLGVGSNENPLETMGQINSLMFVMLSGFITSFLLLQLQMRMLDYLAFACLGYLFPMGIFFRCFEPTRSFGGTLLGISISFFLFYPIIMVFNDYLINDQMVSLTKWQAEVDATANQNAQGGTTPTPQQYSDQVRGIWDPGHQNSNYNSFAGRIADGLLLLINPILVYFIAAVVLPVLNFIVLVEIARGTTAFLGDELDVSNLTRLI
ncbi:MAG: hypothetical protein NTX79_05325 [Candidatus Micrarchaeota archaeon]|nr:hypothetical protein [Candidatus Micrarchaeota archaeon]